MNILVYDVAAEVGGAVSILEYYYEQHQRDKDNHYYYLLSTYHLENTENITVINVESVKRSWINRLFFDYLGVKKYLKEYKIDCVLSLQNIGVPVFKGKQTIYIHNALPFCEYKFSFKEDRKLWVYQNLIGKLMKNSIKKADSIIVQTAWMKDAIIDLVKGKDLKNKIQVIFPKVSIPEGYCFKGTEDKITFLYPANGERFKNHKVVLDACRLLKEESISNYEILFTLVGNESDIVKNLYDSVNTEKLPIHFIGQQKREQLFALYEKSILLFPSFIETVGLPIYEAMQIGAPMLLANTKYAHNLANDYAKATFFNFQDAKELAEIMKRTILEWRSN